MRWERVLRGNTNKGSGKTKSGRLHVFRIEGGRPTRTS